MTEIGLLEAFIVVHSGDLKMKSPVLQDTAQRGQLWKDGVRME